MLWAARAGTFGPARAWQYDVRTTDGIDLCEADRYNFCAIFAGDDQKALVAATPEIAEDDVEVITKGKTMRDRVEVAREKIGSRSSRLADG